MLNRIPRWTPSLSMMLDDLGRPKTETLARALRVSPSTARRWIAADSAPSPTLVAIFWLTSWGHSAVDAEAHNAAILHATHAAVLRNELRRLEAPRVIRDDESANGPAYGVVPPVIESGNIRMIRNAISVTTT